MTVTSRSGPIAVAPARRGARARRVRLWGKRVMDLVLASILLIVLSPLFAVVAVAIRVTSPGPAIFRQTRLGLDRRPFTVFKFRSMRVDADPAIHHRFLLHEMELAAAGKIRSIEHFKVTDDDRVTTVGGIIRRLSIDELPQLVNVVRGEMSLVGPRPDMDYGLDSYEPHQFRRFDVLPGITGLWQVSGRSRLSYPEMLDLDAQYAESWSLTQDVKILLRTIPVLARPDRAG